MTTPVESSIVTEDLTCLMERWCQANGFTLPPPDSFQWLRESLLEDLRELVFNQPVDGATFSLSQNCGHPSVSRRGLAQDLEVTAVDTPPANPDRSGSAACAPD